MTATADMILERRRTRRKLAIWRIAAILAVLIAILAVVPWGGVVGSERGDHVARIEISGPIIDDAERTRAIRRIADRASAKALIVDISSPGGTVVGAEALFTAIRHVGESKPVVAVVGEVAASGGYLAALATDHVVTRQNSITGSIGVISMVPNVSALLERLGIDVREIKSAPLKAAPSTVNPVDPASVEAMEALIGDSFAWFRDIVAERRGLEGKALDRVTDGRVFTGRQGMELGLVDALGARPEARAWLASEHSVSEDLAVRDVTWGERALPFPLDILDRAGLMPGWIGFGGLELSPGPRLMALYTG